VRCGVEIAPIRAERRRGAGDAGAARRQV